MNAFNNADAKRNLNYVSLGVPRMMMKASAVSMKMEFPKALYGLAPALISAPAFASVDVRVNS